MEDFKSNLLDSRQVPLKDRNEAAARRIRERKSATCRRLLVHLGLLFSQCNAPSQNQDGRPIPSHINFAILLFGVAAFLFRDACYEADLDMVIFPEVLSIVVLASIMLGYIVSGFLPLIACVFILILATVSITVVQFMRRKPSSEQNSKVLYAVQVVEKPRLI